MKQIKKFILVGISLILMIGLTGCLNKNFRNLSDSEIIKQIQTKMKTEMDKINFEVNFNDYEFKVNTGVEIQSNYGKVTIKDKRYNYDPIEIYDGNFEVLDKAKIGTNPIIFVGHGYQNYVDNVLLNDKARGNNLDEALRVSGGKLLKMSQVPGSRGRGEMGIEVSLEEAKDARGNGYYYILPTSLATEDYEGFFKGKKSREVNYSDFVEKMNYLVVLVIETKDNITEELKNKMQEYYNEEYVLIVLRKGE
ncbi:MAG: putative lipoprotein [Circular genetic element sp.]|nr:MAG: putative lipoprotein [Circular genetic element sp.]